MSANAAVRGVTVCALLAGCTTRSPTPSPSEADAAHRGENVDASPSGAEQGGPISPVSAEASTDATTPSPSSEVRWFGALSSIMHEGRTEASVHLGDVLPGPHAWGVGALEGLSGEVTILDDIVWFARPRPDGRAQLTHGALNDADKAVGAALLVIANVEAWDELPVDTGVASSDLDGFLEAALTTRGHPLDRPVPMRIDGSFAALRWHVVDGSKMQQSGGHHADHARSAVSGVFERVDAQLVGFFSRDHQGVFTHMGSHSHFHVVSRGGAVSGHVDGVALLAGTRLLVPHR